MTWYDILEKKSVPHLICLSHADRLFVECVYEDDGIKNMEYACMEIPRQLKVRSIL